MAKRIFSDQHDDLPQLIKQVQSFGLSARQLETVIDNILARKEAIFTAALAIGGGFSENLL